jgi:hypothetical protein
MRLSILFALVTGSAFVSSFPTADNVARLARAGGLEVPNDLDLDDVLRQLKRQQEKRLVINSLDSPIKGA